MHINLSRVSHDLPPGYPPRRTPHSSHQFQKRRRQVPRRGRRDIRPVIWWTGPIPGGGVFSLEYYLGALWLGGPRTTFSWIDPISLPHS